jgi:hypothetical protein
MMAADGMAALPEPAPFPSLSLREMMLSVGVVPP